MAGAGLAVLQGPQGILTRPHPTRQGDAGRDCRDAFLGPMKTRGKFGVPFWDYLCGRRLHRFRGASPAKADPRKGTRRLNNAFAAAVKKPVPQSPNAI